MPKSAQKRQSKSLKGTGIKGRPRKDGAPPIQKAQREVVLGSSTTREPANLPVDPPKEGEVHEAAFEVVEAETIREALDTNGIALVNDAYRRAARLATPFDQAVYLTLLGKAHPMAQVNAKDKGLPGSKKKQLKALERIISGQMQVEDAEYRTISGTDGPSQGAGQEPEGQAG
jgi:hypothetical protein